MAIGKKETNVIDFSSGVVTETEITRVNLLNYSKAMIGGLADTSGECNITLKIFGSLDQDAAEDPATYLSGYWTQISADIYISGAQVITPFVVDEAYESIRLTYSKSSSGLGRLVTTVVKKRH
ncbi:MAG: hypothetical protein ACXABY_12655 [Candidatus Thorarchaeota archaeon]|jgi:hypothetical protein